MRTKTTTPTKEVMAKIRFRDEVCVYCNKNFDRDHCMESRNDWDTIEHLNHRQDWDSVGDYMREGKPVEEIVAYCCWECNTNRGAKSLKEWFKEDYCKNNNINYDKVTQAVRDYIDKFEK